MQTLKALTEKQVEAVQARIQAERERLAQASQAGAPPTTPAATSPTATRRKSSSPAYQNELCEQCGGAGQFIREYYRTVVDDDGQAVEEYVRSETVICECREGRKLWQRRLERMFGRCGLTGDLLHIRLRHCADWGNESNRAAFDAALRLVRYGCLDAPTGKRYYGLYLYGPTGVGKTHLAAAALNEAILSNIPAVFAKVPVILDHLRSAYDPDSEYQFDTLFDQLCTVPFLVLDDLGAQRTTPWAIEKLSTIVDARETAKLLTVVTANLSPGAVSGRFEDMGEWQGSRILSRLRGMCFAVHIEGPDARLEGEVLHDADADPWEGVHQGVWDGAWETN